MRDKIGIDILKELDTIILEIVIESKKPNKNRLESAKERLTKLKDKYEEVRLQCRTIKRWKNSSEILKIWRIKKQISKRE
jgi:hypothetical protein